MSNLVPPDPEKLKLLYEIVSSMLKCVECGSRATQSIELVDEAGQPAGTKYFCDIHGPAVTNG